MHNIKNFNDWLSKNLIIIVSNFNYYCNVYYLSSSYNNDDNNRTISTKVMTFIIIKKWCMLTMIMLSSIPTHLSECLHSKL